jgi:hypothetical protein
VFVFLRPYAVCIAWLQAINGENIADLKGVIEKSSPLIGHAPISKIRYLKNSLPRV